jgi:hypothetical protein
MQTVIDKAVVTPEGMYMIGHSYIALGVLVIVSACAAAPKPVPISRPIMIAPPPMLSGLDRVMGRGAGALVALFGPADQDVREENARKLQFSSGICILDAYLYTLPKGKDPVVSYIDARQPDGAPIDRASCIAALTRRKEAR